MRKKNETTTTIPQGNNEINSVLISYNTIPSKLKEPLHNLEAHRIPIIRNYCHMKVTSGGKETNPQHGITRPHAEGL